MMKMRGRSILLLSGAIVAAALAGRVTLLSQQAPAAAPPKTAWPKNGGNLANQNYSLLKQIDRETVEIRRTVVQ